MNWKDRIIADPNVLVGKPVIKNTRLSVEFLLDLFAAGWTRKQVLEGYPHLSSEDINAVFAFAAEMVREEKFIAIGKISSKSSSS